MQLSNFVQQVEISPENRIALNKNSCVQASIDSQQFDDLFNFVMNLLNDPALVNCSKKPKPKYIGLYSCYPTGCTGRTLLTFAPLSSNGNCKNDFWIARISLDLEGIKSAPIYFPQQIIHPNVSSSNIEKQSKIDANGTKTDFAILKNLFLLQHPQQFISIPAIKARLA